jgi:flavin reductase (DIM6/NTAB) family NADH-FMN oxidoreductase RutF
MREDGIGMEDHAAEPADQQISDGIDAFKSAFRRHAAGVAVVTALDPDGKPVGLTITSLASLAAVPPLATFNMARVATAWPAMTVGNRVAIHMLSPRTREVAEIMAGDHTVRFEGDHWEPGPYGLPIIKGATVWILGRIIEVHPVHNNAIVVVEIEDGRLGEPDEALLYHERSYRTPGPRI